MGVYSRKVKGIADVAEGAQVAIPNDPTNGGRALKVLETAGLKDAIAIEAKDSPYANVVAVRTGEENRAEFQKLKAALSSPELKKFLEEQYKGAVVPAF